MALHEAQVDESLGIGIAPDPALSELHLLVGGPGHRMFDAKIVESVQSDVDHFGLRVENMDEAVAELKRRGADFMMEPRAIRPGVRIAFVRAPDNVRIELLERT